MIILLPGLVFFQTRGGVSFLEKTSLKSAIALIFPLFGLYGFTLIWFQIMIGSNIRYLTKIWPKIFLFHRTEGIIAFLFVLVHISFILITYSFEKFLEARFLPENLRIFGILGNFAFYLLVLSTTAALFRQKKLLRKYWRFIHYFNYVVFFLVLIHSLNLGSDTQSGALKYLWYFFATTVVISLINKFSKRFSLSSN